MQFEIKDARDRGVADWEIRKLIDESGTAPPDELVATYAQGVKADLLERHPEAGVESHPV